MTIPEITRFSQDSSLFEKVTNVIRDEIITIIKNTPGSQRDLNLVEIWKKCMHVLKDMQNVVTADTFFAGWIQSEKQCCEIRRDSTFVVKSQLGSSKEYENMNLVVSLTDLEGNIVNRIISEPISVVSPSQICTRSWTVNLHGLGIESNGYRFKLDILDSNGRLLFTTSSLPVAIKY